MYLLHSSSEARFKLFEIPARKDRQRTVLHVTVGQVFYPKSVIQGKEAVTASHFSCELTCSVCMPWVRDNSVLGCSYHSCDERACMVQSELISALN